MSAIWTVTAGTKELVLEKEREDVLPFLVTNKGDTADQAVFDVIPDGETKKAWFSVEEPLWTVRAGATVSIPVKVAVPPDQKPGTYRLYGLVYSAEGAPEENQGKSELVELVVKKKVEETPAKRKWPWWWFAIAGGVVLLLIIIMTLVLTSGGGSEEETSAGPVELGVMPDVLGLTEVEALNALRERNITVRPILYRHDPEQDGAVVEQWTDPDERVDPSQGVTIVVATNLEAPVLTGPVGVVDVAVDAPGGEPLELTWEPGRTLARRWIVTIFVEQCTLGLGSVSGFPVSCAFEETPAMAVPTEEPSLTPALQLPSVAAAMPGTFVTGWHQWYVEPMDDLGNRGERSEMGYFRLQREQG